MSRPRTFRQEDVTRALRAAAKAEQEVRRVEIHTNDHKIVLVMVDQTTVPDPALSTDPGMIVL